MVDFEVLKRVHVCLCNIWSPLTVLLFLPFVRFVDQDSLDVKDESRWVSQPHSWAPSFILKEVETALKACSITRWLLSIHHGYALSIILCCVDSPLSLSQSLHLIPHSAHRDNPFSKKELSNSLLLHYLITLLSLTRSLRGGHHLVFITQQVNLHHAILCVPSLVQTVIQQDKKRSAPPLSTDKTVTILCKEWFWGTDIILSSYSTLKSPIFVQNI